MKGRKGLKFILLVASLTLIGGLSLYQFRALQTSRAEDLVKAPDFSLKNLKGQTVRLSDFAGKVILLNFWATWCPPCRIEIPHLMKLYAKYQDRGLEIIGISLDAGGEEIVKRFVERYQINYAILLGDEKITLDYGGILGIPTSFIIDRQGRIRQRLFGLQSMEALEEAIKNLL